MEVAAVFSALLTLGYVAMMIRYHIWWRRTPEFEIPQNFHPKTTVTVLIPARNEANGIVDCLQGILRQNFPKERLQILVLDDHSTDRTAALAAALPRVEVIYLNETPPPAGTVGFKKHAITQGIARARGELIVCTDADCIVPRDWLRHLCAAYEMYRPAFIAAPVTFTEEQTAFQRFQSLDFLGMMGITGAGISGSFLYMANGANLAYPKAVFEKVEGFGNDRRASGDDMLLLQRIRERYPKGIFYLKNKAAAVQTRPVGNWSDFFQQRLRWGNKTGAYHDWQPKLLLGLAWLFCWSMLVNLLLGIFYRDAFLYVALFQFLAKFNVDFFFLESVSRYFERKDLMRGYFTSQLWHCWYILSVGTAAIFLKNYEWKGRRVR